MSSQDPWAQPPALTIIHHLNKNNISKENNKQTKLEQTRRYRERTGDCQRGGQGWVKEVNEGSKKHKLVVTKLSRGSKA